MAPPSGRRRGRSWRSMTPTTSWRSRGPTSAWGPPPPPAASNNEVGVTLEAVTTDVTAASEDFDLVIKTMTAGAAATEKLRIDATGLTTLGAAGTDGALQFYNELGATDYAVTLTPSASQSASYTLTLPTALPGSTQFLQSTSGGVLAWAAATTAPAGADTQVQYNNAGAFGGSSGLTLNATTVTDMTFAAGAIASADLITGLSDET